MSLANELKDFLTSYTAVSEMGGKKEDRKLRREDSEANKAYREAMLEIQREQIEVSRENSRRAGSAGSTAMARLDFDREKFDYEKEQDRAAREAERFANMEQSLRGGFGSGIPMEPADDGFNVEDYYPTGNPAFNRGGLVDEEEPAALSFGAPAAPAAPAAPEALPLSMGQPAPAAPAAPAPAPEAPAVNPEASRVVVQKAGEAADAAARSFSLELERPASAVDADGQGEPATDIVNNRGGLSMEEYQQVLTKVDPNGRMAPHLQSAAVLAEGYRHFTEQGDLRRAETFAKQILVTQKNMSQTLGALSLQAIEAGNLPEACRLFNDACNKFPSGHEISVTPDERSGLVYTVRNNGEVVDQGRLNTEQFWEQATGVANGSAFLSQVAQFASEQGQRPRPMTPERALDLTNQNFVEYMRARDDLQALTDATKGVDRADLDAANERAQAALAAYNQSVAQAQRLDISRSDIEARNKRAYETALPVVPEPEESKPGMLSRIRDAFTGDGSNPEPDASDPYSQTATTPAPVTPAGNNEPARPPRAGDVVDGWRFKGGNPASQSNWEKVEG